MQVEKLNYDFVVCRDLIENTKKNDNEYTKALKYYHDRVFYVPHSGCYYYYKNGELVRDSIDNFNKCHHMGFNKKFLDCVKKTIVAYDEVLETKNYTVDKEKRIINAFKPIYAEGLKDIAVSEAGHNYVKLFKKFLFEVSSNSNQKYCAWLLNWIASVVQLKRSKVAPVFVTSTEGIGKSTLAVIIEKILGKYNTTHPSSEVMKRFHWQCYGKILVIFEETQGLSGDEGVICNNLKNMINSDTFPYEEKGMQSRDLMNINNVIITSNFPLASTSGRRYVNITPSTKWLHKYELFEQLLTFTDEKIKALYDFLLSIDISNWNAEKEAKNISEGECNLKEIERMNNVFKYMRDTYAMKKVSEKIRTKYLYENYKSVVSKPYNKSTFFEKVSELNIDKTKTNGTEYFVIKGQELFDEFTKRKLIDTDDYEDESDFEEIFSVKKESPEVEALREENEKLKQQIKQLLEAQQKQQEEKKVEEKPEQPMGKQKIKIMAHKSTKQ
jgi:hypothetical protein